MPRFATIAAFALAAVVSAPTSTLSADPWVADYRRWITQIQTSVAGNTELSARAAELQSSLDAAVASGALEADRMRLLYDFLAVADADPKFPGFSLSDTATTPTLTPATAPTTAPLLRSDAPASTALTSAAALAATVVVSYALL